MDRFISMKLFYIDSCNADYQPPGFEQNKCDWVSFPKGYGWRKESQHCARLDSGFHEYVPTKKQLVHHD